MVIRYHRAWGPVMLGLAAMDVVLYVVSGTWWYIAIAPALAVLGVLYLIRPFIVIQGNVLQVKTLIGMTARKFTFDSFAGIDVEPDAILITRAGQRERLKISRLMTRGSDLERLAAAVREARGREPSPAPA